MSLEQEKARLEASQARLEASRIDPKSYVQDLKDIQGLFEAYEEMREKAGRDKEEAKGTLQTVLGLTEDGVREIFQLLRDKDGEICYIGKVSHPCPPFPFEDCEGEGG